MSGARSWRLGVFAAAFVLLGALLWLSAGLWALGEAQRKAAATATQTARSQAGLLASELQKFRLLPLVLGEYPDVTASLSGDVAARKRLDATLALLAGRTDAAAIYAIDRTGLTIAASNAALPTSFVGQNYGFRPYFRDAMRSGAAELFAQGTVSGRPGLYLARRVEYDGRPIGVVVVKVEFDAVEANWAHAAGPTFVTDQHGVILITSVPAWRFHTTHPLDAATIALARRTLQFGTAPLQPAPIALDGGTARATQPGDRRAWQSGSAPVSLIGARLVYLEPLAPTLAAATATIRLWGLIAVIALGIAAGIVIRARERAHLQRRAREKLEEEVARRTAELRAANESLVVESHERAQADRRYRAAREELAQANRLGSLGQITAGVAHEINQPVAAIRTFAENAETLLDRGKPETARANLASIVALTARIGRITAELRGFARRRVPVQEAVRIASVIEGALLLAGDRIREIVTVRLPEMLAGAEAIGDRVRLEQILLNLLQNAAEALGDARDPRIEILFAAEPNLVLIVADNGPGIDPAIADDVFTPFTTGKPDGLGLGLGIARDIARDFGGELAVIESPLGGAAFALRLRRA